MYELEALNISTKQTSANLEEFESFCLGEKHLSPEKFRLLNIELSIGAVLHVGRRYWRDDDDGRHLIWEGTDEREHDLGSITNMHVMRDYPGFNRTRTLALGHDHVESHEVIEGDSFGSITQVKMKDGTIGVGPNYKMALRNAVLKMHLGQKKRTMFSFWRFWKALKK